MKFLISLSVIGLSCIPFYGQSQIFYSPPTNAIVTIDGVMQPGEWDDAYTDQIISSGNGETVTIHGMHDSLGMYFAFESSVDLDVNFPEVFFDMDQSGGNTWDQNDWWFHVSATDCEYRGIPLNYDSCMADRPGWEAHPNWPAAGSGPDTVEIFIEFSLLNDSIIDLPNVAVGFSMAVSNAFNRYDYWPDSATNLNYPSTWGTLEFNGPGVGRKNTPVENAIRIYPNPAFSFLHVEVLEPVERIEIVDVSGRVVHSGTSHHISISHLPPGPYSLIVSSQYKHVFRRFVKL